MSLKIVSGAKSIDLKAVATKIKQTALKFLGENTYADTSLAPIIKNNKLILRTNHNQVNNIRSCLSLIKEVNNIPIILQTTKVSGILKKAEV